MLLPPTPNVTVPEEVVRVGSGWSGFIIISTSIQIVSPGLNDFKIVDILLVSVCESVSTVVTPSFVIVILRLIESHAMSVGGVNVPSAASIEPLPGAATSDFHVLAYSHHTPSCIACQRFDAEDIKPSPLIPASMFAI